MLKGNSSVEEKYANAERVVNSNVKKAVDHTVFVLVEKYGYDLSPSAQNDIVNLSIDFIRRLTDVFKSADLQEPEAFEDVTTNINSKWGL